MKQVRPSTRRVLALPTVAEILDAAVWRLADWQPEEIERMRPMLDQVWEIFRENIGFSSEDPRIKKILVKLKRNDRRDPWTALCALLVLESDSMGECAGVYRAGMDVLNSCRQASRGSAKRAEDALDRLILDNLRNNPEIRSSELFEQLGRLEGMHPVIDSADASAIAYNTGSRTKSINRGAFAERVSKLKRRQETAFPSNVISLENILLRRNSQPVALMGDA